LRKWAAEEIAAGRLLPWLAVSFGFGIVLYFSAEREPVWWAPAALTVACAMGAILLRRQTAAFVVALGLCASRRDLQLPPSIRRASPIRCCASPHLA
jgi:competence protein ComEC